MTAEDLGTDELIELLRLGTSELFHIEAAVRLVERHRYWLEQRTCRRFVELFDDPPSRSADIWWKDAVAALDRGELECDQEAANVLRIAASIATFYEVSFRDVMERLSLETMKYAAEALMCAGGYPESVAMPKF